MDESVKMDMAAAVMLPLGLEYSRSWGGYNGLQNHLVQVVLGSYQVTSCVVIRYASVSTLLLNG